MRWAVGTICAAMAIWPAACGQATEPGSETQPAQAQTQAQTQTQTQIRAQTAAPPHGRLAFAAVRAAALDAAPGEILEVELDDESGAGVYEFKILSATGRVIEVELDAVTGAVLKLEQD